MQVKLSSCILSLVAISWYFSPLPVIADDATIFLSPATGTFSVGDDIKIDLHVSSGAEAVKTIHAKLNYNPNIIEVQVDSSPENSVITSWPEGPSIDNELGTISFMGWLATSTVLDRGLVLTLNVHIIRAGKISVDFESESLTVSDIDGAGGAESQNILSSFSGGLYLAYPKDTTPIESDSYRYIPPPEPAQENQIGEVLGVATGTPLVEISSASHPNQEMWYNATSATLHFNMPAEVSNMRFGVSKKPHVNPSELFARAMSGEMITTLDEGISYAHLVVDLNSGEELSADYRLQADLTQPVDFTISEGARNQLTDPNIIFTLNATDTLSGIDHYEFDIDDEKHIVWVDDGSHQYHFRASKPGTHSVVASAVDVAGNKTSEQLTIDVAYLAAPLIALQGETPIEGERLNISYTATPNSTLQIAISHNGETQVVENAPVVDSGKGFYDSVLTLSPGMYDVYATLSGINGELSNESEHISLEVPASFWGLVSRHPLMPFVGVALFALLVFAGYSVRRIGMRGIPVDEHDRDDGVARENIENVFELGLETNPATQVVLQSKVRTASVNIPPTRL